MTVWRGILPLLLAGASTLNAAEPVSPEVADPGPSSHAKMLRLLRHVADRTSEENLYQGDRMARRLRSQLATLPDDWPASSRSRLQLDLAKAELIIGNETESIELYTRAIRSMTPAGPDPWPEELVLAHFDLGVAYMRHAETRNCCLHHAPESCILPLQGGAIHREKDPSRQAIERFAAVLDRTGATDELHLAARWLLNIAYMTLGAYPDGVPEAHRMPPEGFHSEEAIPRFENIARKLGLDVFDLSGGAIGDDFDNDGYLDIAVSTWDSRGQMNLFRNEGDGTFSRRTESAGLLGLLGGLNMVQADYDNDGDVDILVLRGAWLQAAGRHPNSLLRNNGDLTFTDMTFHAGLAEVHYPTQTASWGDYDGDGDLDLYIGNETTPPIDAPCQLFRNNGDGTFTDVAAAAGVQNNRGAKSVIWGDYDGDRLPDLYVSNLGAPNRLYRNNGDGTFVDVAEKLGVTRPQSSFPSWFFDIDNDGDLDLFSSAYLANVEHITASLLKLSVNDAMFARLYRSDGVGGFEEIAREFGLVHPSAPMGSNFGDLDNDGYLDFYLGTGDPNLKNLMPNLMFLNRRGEGFVDVSYSGGFAHLQKGHGVVFADFDNDGDQDVFEQMGGAYAADGYRNVFYENPGFGNHWIAVQLVGVRSNRSAIGARIRAEVVEDGVVRSIYKHVNSGGTFGGNPLRQTIGLGRAATVRVLEVLWPTSGLTQTFRDVPAGRFVRIVEGEADYTTLSLRKLSLGADPASR